MSDYFTCGSPNTMECAANLTIMSYTCNYLGFGIQRNKFVYPTTVMEYIGIEIDTIAMQLRITQERLDEIMIQLSQWKQRSSCTKREILSLVGKLSFVSRVVRPGRTFVRRLIDLSKTARYLHYRIHLTKAARADIRWWELYLPTWNGISVFYDASWTSNIDISMWSDASDWGMGACYNNSWIYERFNDHLKCHSIAWRELYALVKAAATWGRRSTRQACEILL